MEIYTCSICHCWKRTLVACVYVATENERLLNVAKVIMAVKYMATVGRLPLNSHLLLPLQARQQRRNGDTIVVFPF